MLHNNFFSNGAVPQCPRTPKLVLKNIVPEFAPSPPHISACFRHASQHSLAVFVRNVIPHVSANPSYPACSFGQHFSFSIGKSSSPNIRTKFAFASFFSSTSIPPSSSSALVPVFILASASSAAANKLSRLNLLSFIPCNVLESPSRYFEATSRILSRAASMASRGSSNANFAFVVLRGPPSPSLFLVDDNALDMKYVELYVRNKQNVASMIVPRIWDGFTRCCCCVGRPPMRRRWILIFLYFTIRVLVRIDSVKRRQEKWKRNFSRFLQKFK